MFWENHKKKIVTALFVAIIGVPLIIHVLFKIHPAVSFFSAEWSAGDLLGFYGVLLGACATVAGVYLTVRYAQANYREDVINRSIPFLTVTPLKDTNYMQDEIYYVIQKGAVQIKARLSDLQRKHIEDGGFINQKMADGVYATRSLKMFYVPLQVKNVGNGAAVTFAIGLNPKRLDKDKHLFSLPRSLSKGDSFRFAIYSENIENDNYGEYTLCFSYYDILGNAYEQNFTYSIKAGGVQRDTYGALSLDGTQHRLGKEEKQAKA